MAIDRLRVTNHEVWGKLVKTWATGINYLGDGNDYPLRRPSRSSSSNWRPRRCSPAFRMGEVDPLRLLRLRRDRGAASAQTHDRDFRRASGEAGCHLSDPGLLPTHFPGHGSGHSGGGSPQGPCRAHRRLYGEHLRLRHSARSVRRQICPEPSLSGAKSVRSQVGTVRRKGVRQRHEDRAAPILPEGRL